MLVVCAVSAANHAALIDANCAASAFWKASVTAASCESTYVVAALFPKAVVIVAAKSSSSPNALASSFSVSKAPGAPFTKFDTVLST